MQDSHAEQDKKAYRIAEQLPSDSSDEDYSGSDKEERPEKQSPNTSTVSDNESESEEDDRALDVEDVMEVNSTPDNAPESARSAKAQKRKTYMET